MFEKIYKLFIDIKDIEVDDKACMESCPCKHHVNIIYKNGETERKLMDGVSIYKLLKMFGKNTTHFNMYKNFKFNFN